MGAIELLLRNVEATVELARRDLALLPGGYLTSRAAWEAAVKVQWLLAPDDTFDREGRWVAMIGEGIADAHHNREWLEQLGKDASSARNREIALRGLRDGVSVLLHDRGVATVERLPNLEQICRAVGVGDKYGVYRHASQYTHSTWVATELYQHNLGIDRLIGEFIDVHYWQTPLGLCWQSVCDPLRLALSRWNGTPVDYPTDAVMIRGNAAITLLGEDWTPELGSPAP